MPLGGTETPASQSVHTLQLAGNVAGNGGRVLVRARIAYQAGSGCTLELTVRSERADVPALIISAIA